LGVPNGKISESKTLFTRYSHAKVFGMPTFLLLWPLLINILAVVIFPVCHINKIFTLCDQVTVAYNKDPSPVKLNLGVGAY